MNNRDVSEKAVPNLLSLKLNTEGTIQAEFYHQCRKRGMICACEVVTNAGILDVVVLNGAKTGIVTVVECKQEGTGYWGTKQIARYSTLGVPVLLLDKLADCRGLAERVKREYWSEAGGKALAEIAAMPRPEFWARRKKRVRGYRVDECLVVK